MPKAQSRPIPENFTDLFEYDSLKGIIRWKTSKGNSRPGDIAGGLSTKGYMAIGVDRKVYLSHRIAWFLHYGEQPPEYIDHIDNDRINNKISNLRRATFTENRRNSKTRSGRSGVKGVSWSKGKWLARIYMNGKRIVVGRFNELFEAKEAIQSFRKNVHHEFANNG